MWRRWLTKTAVEFPTIPTPKKLPFFGTTLSLMAAGSAPKLHEYIDKRHRKLGDIFREKIGPVEAVFVANSADMRKVFSREGRYPKHVLPEAWLVYNEMFGCKRGLFFMDGEEWHTFRRIMNKLLLKSDSLQWLQEPCEHVAASFTESWHGLLKNNESAIIMNLESKLYRVSIDVILSVLLGNKYNDHKHKLEKDVEYLASIVHKIFLSSSKLMIIPAKFAVKYRLPVWRNFVESADDALNVAYKITKKIIEECPQGDGLISKMTKENINPEDIARIVADLILAAGDTTAYSTQWILYLLAKSPEIQEKISETQDDNYVKCVVREGLRLYPVAPFLTRIMPQDTSIGGYFIPSGTLIIMSIYSSSRDPKNFPHPNKFWPERWEKNGVRDFTAACPNASLPFAMGSRSCVGRKIAEMQMAAIIKKITNNFKLELVDDNNVNMILRMVSVPDKPILIKITRK